jgi:hypothetical protein
MTKSSGRLAVDWFGQFLFSIDYFDANGKAIERPELINSFSMRNQ